MGLAPTFEELEAMKLQNKSTHEVVKTMSNSEEIPIEHRDFSYGFSKIAVIGTGGAGKMAAIRYAKSSDPECNRVITIDTSGIQADIPNIEAFKIKDLNGSGKLRKGNIEAISNFIADFTSKTVFELVNIVITSCSGGSGSVIAPLLVDEILRQDKIAIVIGIIDTDSEIDTTNAFNCLRTYDNISKNRKAYIPTVLFDNTNSRQTVDRGIDTILKNLAFVLTTPFIGLDLQDRIKFLNPQVFDDVDCGVKLLNISTRDDGEWESDLGLIINPPEPEKIDSVMIITHSDIHIGIKKRCSVIFRGYFDTPNTKNVVASAGYQIPPDFIKNLNADIHAFKSTLTTKPTEFVSEYEIGSTNKNGLVL